MNENKITSTILEMYEEADNLTAKYGKSSKIAQKVLKQAEAFAELWDEYQMVKHSNKLYEISYTSSMLLREKKKGKSYEEQARLNGWNHNDWKQLDKIEDKINYILKTTMA